MTLQPLAWNNSANIEVGRSGRDEEMARNLITVVIPSRNSPTLGDALESIVASDVPPHEVIVVDSSHSTPIALRDTGPRSGLISSISANVRPFEARMIGTRRATGTHVLFVDSDQVIERGLIEELSRVREPCSIVPESMAGVTRIDRIVGRRKHALEEEFRDSPTFSIAVCPRFYRKDVAEAGFARLDESGAARQLWQHEDSILFRAAFEASGLSLASDVHFARHRMVNSSLDYMTFMRKTVGYGVNSGVFVHFALKSQLPFARQSVELDLPVPFLSSRRRFSSANLMYSGLRVLPYSIGLVLGFCGIYSA